MSVRGQLVFAHSWADIYIQTASDNDGANPEMRIIPATPQRTTPPSSSSRGRVTARYPSRLTREDPERVPLHRRGTSSTYERLEDLLREAGYKETKIYSPEVERTEGRGEGRKDGSARGGMGVVVDFLTGLMPGSSKADGDDLPIPIGEAINRTSPPASPLTGKRQRISSLRPIAVEDYSDSLSSLGSPRPRYGRLPHHHPTSSELGPFMNSSASASLRAHVHMSAAQGYLRHIASTPNISKASRSHQAVGPSKLQFISGEQPPLPSNWFDSVTKAVLGSSSSVTHVGGPSHTARHDHRPTRATKENRPVPHSIKNKVRPVTGYLRAETAPGAVNTVRVVCRSAPASRSSSRIGARLMSVSDKGKTRDSSIPRFTKSRSAQSDVPSLANTRLENDAWNFQWQDGERVSSVATDDEYSDEDEEGELDLARILVPPKRQKSIRSLRQHLHRSESARALRGDTLRPLSPWSPHDDDDRGKRRGTTRSKSRRGSMEDEHDEYGTAWDLHGYEHPGPKKRKTLPGTWSNRSLGKS